MQANETDIDLATTDLGPLAWVLDELRKSLASACAALRRFVRDTGLARGADMASVDAGQLRIARQQLHQAVGALEMVGLAAPAHMLRGMEGAVQQFVERPELCNEQAAAKVERAGFALAEYLEGVLLGKAVSAVALFPQYRDVQELAGASRIHPADLWALEWRWNEPDAPAAVQPLDYAPALRSRIDQNVLSVVKTGDAAAARALAELSLSLAATQAPHPRIFWKLCAGYFEALAADLLVLDIHVKRAASRILLQYASLAKGDPEVSERLALDLLFFCSQAVPAQAQDAPALAAVRLAWGLARFGTIDYATPQFGRFDPTLLTQARKRIGVAKETWSVLAGGDPSKVKHLTEQFRAVSESLLKLHPASGALAQALAEVAEGVARAGRAPGAELAMEVATALLYLEAVLDDLDPADAQLATRTARLAQRLERVQQGGQPEALEPWMEELYRRVSHRQTMGSVVGELRGTLGELEKQLDQFFRNLKDKTPLRGAPAHLTQMRGVLSVLGLDQAAQAVVRMRDSVEELLVIEIDEELARSAGTFDKLGNNLGALGFLIDMLNYQPALAKKLFVYDEATGELRPLMGRSGHSALAPATGDGPRAQPMPLAGSHWGESVPSDHAASVAGAERAAAGQAEPADPFPAFASAAGAAPEAVPVAPAPSESQRAAVAAEATAAGSSQADAESEEIREIFLDEAKEVIQHGTAAIQVLTAEPRELAELTTLRRAFHTLKGSSRMVGLADFGEAAWSLEQVLNTWLADQKPATGELLGLAGDAMRGFSRWIEDIAAGRDGAWKAGMFRAPADMFRTQGRLVALALPDSEPLLIEPASADISPVRAEPQPLQPVVAPAEAEPLEPVIAAAEAEPLELVIAPAEPGFEPVADVPDLPDAAAPAAPGPIESSDVAPEPAAFEVEPFEPSPLESIAAASAGFEFDFNFEPSPAQPPALEESASGTGAGQLPPALESDRIEAAESAGLANKAAAGFRLLRPTGPGEEDAVAPAAAAPVAASGPAAGNDSGFEPADAVEGQRDDQIKVIGSLRIGIPLYNVYLNEADEWSRRLATEVAEWSLELNQPLPDSTVGLAHALAGSSATVGFSALSEIARALERSLQHTQTLAHGTPQHGAAFTQAAEEIRRLLHQFAAGFLKEPNAGVLEALLALGQLDVAPRDEPAADGAGEGAASAAKAQSPAPESLKDDQEDIDVADAVDPDLFPIFEDEALELMPQLGGALRQWVARPENRSARDEVLRGLHTLKGSARLAGALRLGELAHRMESQIEYLGGETLPSASIEPLLQRFDAMQARLDALRATGGRPAEMPAPPTEVAAHGQTVPLTVAPTGDAGAVPPVLARPVATNLAPQRATANQAVRVRSELLDRLVNQAGEVMITRSRLEAELRQLRSSLADLTGNLDRLRTHLRDIELQAESQMQSRLAQAKDSAANFDPLEFDRFTRVQELTRMMAESVNDVATVQRNLQRTVEATEDDLIAQARQTRELQRDLLRTRMVEFESIADRLYRVVRLAAKESGKQVKLDITGGSIEMDRGVLDRMTPAFEHLLRNCVAHGIEDPAARVAAGKDPSGTIQIDLHHEGNDVSVHFRDDGAGLDLRRIRDQALQRGLIPPGKDLSEEQAAELIFTPGFSTATQVTELSGRGIGTDVVRTEVNSLGGRIETRTATGQGASFKLVLPLTTAVTQVVMVRAGSLCVGVPSNVVEIVRRATAAEVAQAYDSGFFALAGDSLPFYWAGALLQSSRRSSEAPGRSIPVVVFRSAAQRIAVHVDEVLGNQEVVVKNLGPQLARLPGLAGMTVLASGAVVLIYNPVALTTFYGEQARQLSAQSAQPEAPDEGGGAADSAAAAARIPLVLVVDDSITVRRVTQRLLQREGYRVSLAADGLQALEQLAEERPAVVLSDIEMPRMDGFDLARNIRSDARLKNLPIIMITSRIAQKHREHARELGVDHYLGKPYSEEELLSLVKHYSTPAILA